MHDTARAFWVMAPGVGDIRDEQLALPGEADVVVRTLFSGVSRGTEALVFEGRVPESEQDRMTAPFQAGRFPGPVKYGYASVGEVERGPDRLCGRRVFVLYPHQTRYVVPATAAHLVPPNVPPERAVLAANMETALNGLWDAAPRVGDRVSIVGAGVVGVLTAWLASRIIGCEVELIDLQPSRATIASVLGVSFALPHTARDNADVVIHASGAPEGLALALRIAAFEATIVEMSWYGSRAVTVPLGEAFHSRRLVIKSSQVGHVAGEQRARWPPSRRMALALALLAEPLLDALITGESRFDSMPDTMRRLATAPGETLCHRIRYT